MRDGLSLNISESKWLLWSDFFKVITPFNSHYLLPKVGDFIDDATRAWKEEVVDIVFLPVDAKVIKSPLWLVGPEID